mmetsp:Transcript_39815/g.95810  ORF Transcript_39815/g.95810 Transcript_39815/m.95810 type:complete len:221 (+) Transcript_39815:135-797(+)
MHPTKVPSRRTDPSGCCSVVCRWTEICSSSWREIGFCELSSSNGDDYDDDASRCSDDDGASRRYRSCEMMASSSALIHCQHRLLRECPNGEMLSSRDPCRRLPRSNACCLNDGRPRPADPLLLLASSSCPWARSAGHCSRDNFHRSRRPDRSIQQLSCPRRGDDHLMLRQGYCQRPRCPRAIILRLAIRRSSRPPGPCSWVCTVSSPCPCPCSPHRCTTG